MKPVLPLTIHRSLYGLFKIFAAGVLSELIVLWLVKVIVRDPASDPTVVYLALFIMVVILVVTIVSIVIYDSGKIVLTEEGVAVTNFVTLFISTQAVTQWNSLQDINVKQIGFLSSILGIGTMLFQSAGTETNLSLTNVPRANYWRDYMFERMNRANPNDDAKEPL